MKNKNVAVSFGYKDKIGYTLGDFGCNMSFQLVSSYAMIYFTQGMGLSLGAWAVIVVIAKIFDAINDPVIGILVDKRIPSKRGKFRPWIFWGGFAIMITTALLFADIRSFSYAGKFAYCLIMYCVWSIAYTSANVPYGSLNAALTDDINERAVLSSLRSIGAGLGTLPIMIALPKLIYGAQDPVTGISPILPERFFRIALVLGTVGLVGFLSLYFLTWERNVVDAGGEKYDFKKAIVSFAKNRPALGICLASFAQLAFIFSINTMVQYVYQVYFKNTDMIIIATILIQSLMIVFIPFVSKLTLKFGKKESAVYPMIGSIAIFAVLVFVPFPADDTGAWLYLLLMGLANGCTGIFSLTTWSFVADAVDYQELKTGRREEGTVYSVYSFVRKIGQAVCQGLLAILLAAVGFDTNNVVATTQETAANILKLSIILPLIGAVIMFAALKFIYNLDKKSTIELFESLRAIHEQSGNQETQ